MFCYLYLYTSKFTYTRIYASLFGFIGCDNWILLKTIYHYYYYTTKTQCIALNDKLNCVFLVFVLN